MSEPELEWPLGPDQPCMVRIPNERRPSRRDAILVGEPERTDAIEALANEAD